ncbi:MAG: ATPase, partial [Lachnospiraceae bacterium]|nr:ATPase [Lachnospiraceae bacterium]
HAPVSVMETAGEGGAWGIALLAAYMRQKEEGETLADYLSGHVFAEAECVTVEPDSSDVAGFEAFMERYTKGLGVERAAIENLSEA